MKNSTVKTQEANAIPLQSKQLEMLITSMVEVTKQRERLTLDECFSRVISRLTEARSLTIFHLQTNDNGVLVVPVLYMVNSLVVTPRSANLMPFLLSSNALLAEFLSNPNTAEISSISKNEDELILPLQGASGEIAAYCRLENPRNDANTQQILPLLLEFYMSFLTLLDDNERDALTGLLNRKTFDSRIAQITSTMQNQELEPVANHTPDKFYLATLDIDHFKNVNDTFGHIYGDEVLLLFANLMKKTFRNNGFLFRFGGEEFVVLLTSPDVAHALIALERFRSVIENYKFPQIGQITVSIGVASISSSEMPRITTDRADQALYYAKQNGRNQIHVYEELVTQGLLKEHTIQTGDIELF